MSMVVDTNLYIRNTVRYLILDRLNHISISNGTPGMTFGICGGYFLDSAYQYNPSTLDQLTTHCDIDVYIHGKKSAGAAQLFLQAHHYIKYNLLSDLAKIKPHYEDKFKLNRIVMWAHNDFDNTDLCKIIRNQLKYMDSESSFPIDTIELHSIYKNKNPWIVYEAWFIPTFESSIITPIKINLLVSASELIDLSFIPGAHNKNNEVDTLTRNFLPLLCFPAAVTHCMYGYSDDFDADIDTPTLFTLSKTFNWGMNYVLHGPSEPIKVAINDVNTKYELKLKHKFNNKDIDFVPIPDPILRATPTTLALI